MESYSNKADGEKKKRADRYREVQSRKAISCVIGILEKGRRAESVSVWFIIRRRGREGMRGACGGRSSGGDGGGGDSTHKTSCLPC